MQRVIEKAQKVAPRSVPVLIEGESGTGKEMLARAIHEAGPRRNAPFIPVNCGAIPKDLVESEFFGHKKGAFTGAQSDRKGHFEMASGGTLFLDEVGELPLEIQVKLLRVLQQREVVRVGESSPMAIDVRIVAATNRTLSQEVTAGRFREDLFYRLAVAVIRLPPLRIRTGDLTLLSDYLLNKINRDSASEPAWEEKKLSVGARNLLMQHSWPGNVRELLNTLTRAVVLSTGSMITEEDLKDALLDTPSSAPKGESILDRPLLEGFDLQELMSTVARHYLERALDKTSRNRTKAAEMLGLRSYQTLNNWLKKYGLEN
jgi:transcriptional regulator with PAS, ATPase and Fis domain